MRIGRDRALPFINLSADGLTEANGRASMGPRAAWSYRTPVLCRCGESYGRIP